MQKKSANSLDIDDENNLALHPRKPIIKEMNNKSKNKRKAAKPRGGVVTHNLQPTVKKSEFEKK